MRVLRRREFAGRSPRGRALVVIETTSVRIDRPLQTHLLGQEPEWHLQFERCTPVLGPADGILCAIRIDVAWTNAVGSEAANEVRTHLELIQHAQLRIA